MGGRRERKTKRVDVACGLARFAWCRIMSRAPSHELSADRDVMLAAVRCDATLLKYAASALRSDRAFILAAVQQDASCLRYASIELRADREVVLAAVKKGRNAASCLRYASTELRADREVVLAAVKKGRHAVKFVAPELLKAELALVLAAVHQDTTTHLKYAPLRADLYVILAAIHWASLYGDLGLGSEMTDKIESLWCWPAPGSLPAEAMAALEEHWKEEGYVTLPAEAMASLEKEWKAQCYVASLRPLSVQISEINTQGRELFVRLQQPAGQP